jgi:hypothetical protein
VVFVYRLPEGSVIGEADRLIRRAYEKCVLFQHACAMNEPTINQAFDSVLPP